MRPLVADGGELTVLRSLAAYSYGQWSVEWPDSVPESQRPELPDEREFGYVAKLDKEPGRMGRRFVRADVSITAAEYTPEGKVIPFSGFSDVEQVIDEAASRTTGDVFFEREIERAGLNGNIPYVDFDVDDLVPVTLWGKSTIAPVTSIQEVTEASEAVGWRVRVGGDLIADDVARERANRDIEAAIAQERRERTKDVATVSAVASSAQSTADMARGEVQAVRDTLAGEQAEEPDLVSQLVAVNDELQRLGQEPQPSLMLAFVQLSTALWQAQQKINAQQLEFNKQQEDIDASQFQMIEQIADVQRKMVEQSRGQLNTVLMSQYGSSHPNFPVEKISDTQWACEFPTTSSMIHAEYYTFTETTDGAKPLQTVREDFRPGADRRYKFFLGPTEYLRVSWGKTPIVQRSSDTSNGAVEVAQSAWQTLGEHTVQVGKSAEGFSAHFRVLWNAVNRGSLYGVRIVTSAGAVLAATQSSTFGPLGPLGNGRLSMSTSCSGRDVGTDENVYFQVYCSAGGPNQRRVYSGASQSTWVEDI